jgi:predicted nucleic acid-binding protein
MSVLVDSSVWIDHLRGVLSRETAVLDLLLERRDPAVEHEGQGPAADLVVADLVLCEVLRGIPFPREYAAVKNVLLSFDVVTIGGVELALRAADHYRALRRRGITVRKTIDLLIGTFCIVNDCVLLHCDRDFDPMTRHLGLRVL